MKQQLFFIIIIMFIQSYLLIGERYDIDSPYKRIEIAYIEDDLFDYWDFTNRTAISLISLDAGYDPPSQMTVYDVVNKKMLDKKNTHALLMTFGSNDDTVSDDGRFYLLLKKPVTVAGVANEINIWIRNKSMLDTGYIIIEDMYGIEFKIPFYMKKNYDEWDNVVIKVPSFIIQFDMVYPDMQGLTFKGFEFRPGHDQSGSIGIDLIWAGIDDFLLRRPDHNNW